MSAITVIDFQVKTGLLVQDTGSKVGTLDPEDKIFQNDPVVGLTELSFDAAVERYQGIVRAVESSSVADVQRLTSEYIRSARSYAYDGYGDTDYWSKRTKRFAMESAEFAARVGLKCDERVGNAIGSLMSQAVSTTRNYAFNGYGGVSYWSRRCKQFAADMTDLARQIELKVACAGDRVCAETRMGEGAARQPARLHHPSRAHVSTPENHSDLSAVKKLTADLVTSAQRYAYDGYGGTSYWSKRTKELAMEGGIFAARVALECGPEADVAIQAQVEELLSTARDYAFNGYGGTTYWSRRCKALAGRLTDLARQIEFAAAKAIGC